LSALDRPRFAEIDAWAAMCSLAILTLDRFAAKSRMTRRMDRFNARLPHKVLMTRGNTCRIYRGMDTYC